MSDEEEWGGYEDDSTDEIQDSRSTTVSLEEEKKENVQRKVTEDDLNVRAILVDAQTLWGSSNQAFPTRIVEISLVVLQHPLSKRYAKETLRSVVLHQPSVNNVSRMYRDVLSNAALQASEKHGIAPNYPMMEHWAKRAATFFDDQRKKHQKVNSYKFIVGNAEDTLLSAELNKILCSVTGPKAFLTTSSRLADVKSTLQYLSCNGVNLDPYEVFDYETVADGPKFLSIDQKNNCLFHKDFGSTAVHHCCNATTEGLTEALKEAAARLSQIK